MLVLTDAGMYTMLLKTSLYYFVLEHLTIVNDPQKWPTYCLKMCEHQQCPMLRAVVPTVRTVQCCRSPLMVLLCVPGGWRCILAHGQGKVIQVLSEPMGRGLCDGLPSVATFHDEFSIPPPPAWRLAGRAGGRQMCQVVADGVGRGQTMDPGSLVP